MIDYLLFTNDVQVIGYRFLSKSGDNVGKPMRFSTNAGDHCIVNRDLPPFASLRPQVNMVGQNIRGKNTSEITSAFTVEQPELRLGKWRER
jgi:hypothetical protein